MSTITRRTSVPFDISQEKGSILDILQQYAMICSNEFCGKCMPCRYGTREWTSIIQRIIDGKGSLNDLQELQAINLSMKISSFCRLGLVSPFVIDSILKYYKQDLENYISNKVPLPSMNTLPKFMIKTDLCNGCPSMEKAPCQSVCSVNAIDGIEGLEHTINQAKCFRCDECPSVCPTNAIVFY